MALLVSVMVLKKNSVVSDINLKYCMFLGTYNHQDSAGKQKTDHENTQAAAQSELGTKAP